MNKHLTGKQYHTDDDFICAVLNFFFFDQQVEQFLLNGQIFHLDKILKKNKKNNAGRIEINASKTSQL